jgi:hypothetical protein
MFSIQVENIFLTKIRADQSGRNTGVGLDSAIDF